MINSNVIYDKAEFLVEKFATRNPIEIVDYLDIDVIKADFEELLGMYTIQQNKRIILLNRSISEFLSKMVIGHELGHDQLHREEAKINGLQEFSLLCKTRTLEYEANAFCSHIFIDNDDIIPMIYEGRTVEELAATFGVDANLIMIKVRELNKIGILKTNNVSDYNSCFLKRLRT